MLSGIDEAQRRHLHRIVRDVAPDIDFHEALLQPRLRFVGRQEIADPLRAGLLRVVVVHAAHRRAMAALDAAIGSADRVVEHHDLGRPRLALDQGFDLGIVGAAYLVAVVEVADRGRVLRQDERLMVERKIPRDRPRIVNAHLEVAVVAVAPRHPFAERRIVGHRLDAEVGQVGNGGLDPGGRDRPGSGRLDGSDIRHDRTRSGQRFVPIDRVAFTLL